MMTAQEIAHTLGPKATILGQTLVRVDFGLLNLEAELIPNGTWMLSLELNDHGRLGVVAALQMTDAMVQAARLMRLIEES